MKRLRIVYGGTALERDFQEAVTIGQLKNDPSIQAYLGCSNNVNAVVNGMTLPDSSIAPAYDGCNEIVFETKANEKQG